jgi:DNA-binding XRE family transcriptional regulator
MMSEKFRYFEQRKQEGRMSIDLGGRLRSLRIAHNLSQRMLAKRAGVTKSTI